VTDGRRFNSSKRKSEDDRPCRGSGDDVRWGRCREARNRARFTIASGCTRALTPISRVPAPVAVASVGSRIGTTATAAQDSYSQIRDHHTKLAAFRDRARLRASRHRPQRTSSPDPRHGRSSSDFSLEELKRLPSVTRIHFLECNADSAPSGPTGAFRTAPNATAQDTHGFYELQRLDGKCRCPYCSSKPACRQGQRGSSGRIRKGQAHEEHSD